MSYILNPADLVGKAGHNIIVNQTEDGYEISPNPQPKIYRALLTQTGTDDPTAIILENTIGAIVWTRGGAGIYVGTLTGAFTNNKTAIIVGSSSGDANQLEALITDVNSVDVHSVPLSDATLLNSFVQILVYPT